MTEKLSENGTPRRWHRLLAILAMLLIIGGCAGTGGSLRGADTPESGRWILLEESQASEVTSQCSRSAPSDFTGTWTPTAEDLRRLEDRLHMIRRLRAKLCCLHRAKIGDPERFHRQYVGLIRHGKRVIYINAYYEDDPRSRVSSDAMVICDGGCGSWGVVFDPASQRFSELACNGIA